jgi:uncharacterized membrane protein
LEVGAVTNRIRSCPRIPFSIPIGVVRSTALLWLLLRLLTSVAAFGLYLGGLRVTVAVILVTVGLVLYQARRTNERLFAENMGIPEWALGIIALLTATTAEILLWAARTSLGVS